MDGVVAICIVLTHFMTWRSNFARAGVLGANDVGEFSDTGIAQEVNHLIVEMSTICNR